MTEQQIIYRNIEAGENKLICQQWILKERGWDPEPDGFSLHLSRSALEKFVKEYWDTMPDYPVPDEYSAPDGYPYMVYAGDETLMEVIETGSARYSGHPPAKH